ncbi:helix-turn-helix transcriptional regulator [Ancylobacter sp.]|uniref:helix-turn-helix transcriptional regulator n=1 Tax=Ancylobacter sp. TaxID=1872567 RepID=UPI003C7B4719
MTALASSPDTWNAMAPELVARIGTPDFAPSLAAALGSLAPFDLDCVFAYPGQARPRLLHDGLKGISSAPVMQNYLDGTYLLDAVYTSCLRRVPTGVYRLADLAPDDFFEGEYYNSPDVHPCISMESGALAEEVVFLVPVGSRVYLAYSLMRQNASGPFSDEAFGRLVTAAPLVTAMMASHWRQIGEADEPSAASPPPAPEEAMELAFRTFLPTHLTPREQTIVSLVLRGHSSLSIGNLLDIAEGTVKIHRKNLYAKLGISSQTELFNLFLKHILKEGAGPAKR